MPSKTFQCAKCLYTKTEFVHYDENKNLKDVPTTCPKCNSKDYTMPYVLNLCTNVKSYFKGSYKDTCSEDLFRKNPSAAADAICNYLDGKQVD